MGDERKPTALGGEEHAKSMDAERFAYISDDTYTADEVEECTQVSNWQSGRWLVAVGAMVAVMLPVDGWQVTSGDRGHDMPPRTPPSPVPGCGRTGAQCAALCAQRQDVPALALVPSHHSRRAHSRRHACVHAGQVRARGRAAQPQPPSFHCGGVCTPATA